MEEMNYILGHGSGNHFVMIDAVGNDLGGDCAGEMVREVCEVFGSDGLLFVEYDQSRGLYAMNMYNTDGTQAEMCGNGMRLVARYVDENYLHAESFTLLSGGAEYKIRRIGGEVATYGVDIAIRLASGDFTLGDGSFIAEVIEPLDPTLRFTYLNLGNPHIVAKVESVDLELLSSLGERVKSLKEIFPNGINVSFMSSEADNEIFVATYERGVGLTPSCGTAMTASSTTAALLGVCEWDREILVRNRGGFVKCICHKDQSITTQLIGNATYVERGVITADYQRVVERVESAEIEAWSRILE